MQKIYEEYVGEARDEIKKSHPLAAQSIPLLAALSDAMGYQSWRAARSYDHMDITYGARMRDGSAGYSINFYEAPPGATGRVSVVQISSEEMKELFAKVKVVLEGEVLWRYER
jgi:hypothetical protein